VRARGRRSLASSQSSSLSEGHSSSLSFFFSLFIFFFTFLFPLFLEQKSHILFAIFSLADVIENDKINLTWGLKFNIMLDIARGINYLHTRVRVFQSTDERGRKFIFIQTPPIIHRDLKSDNIMIAKDFRAVVADFGILQALILLLRFLFFSSSQFRIGQSEVSDVCEDELRDPWLHSA
jgi:hypothetical protein